MDKRQFNTGEKHPLAKSRGAVLQEAEWAEVVRALRLSYREQQIMAHVLSERSEAQIAAAIGLSESTVHTYMGRLYRKLNVRSRPGAIIAIFACYADSVRSLRRMSAFTDVHINS